MAANTKSEEFKVYLEDTVADDTSNDIDELTNELAKRNNKETVSELLDHFKNLKTELEISFDKERNNMEDNFEIEKSDIVKGFIIEKKILTKEHEKEKENLINNFIKERETMLHDFQEQVRHIEAKMKTHHQGWEKKPSEAQQTCYKTKPASDQEILKPNSNSKLLIKLDENKLVSPEEYITTLELEEQFENEKEHIEIRNRKERENLKKKIEEDCEKKLLRQKQKYEKELRELQTDIEGLKNISNNVSGMWNSQASRLEEQFLREKADLEKRHKDEKEKLRRRLEERHKAKLTSQQTEYDKNIDELKSELKKIKKDFTFLKRENSSKENVELIKLELTKKLQTNFDQETKIIREQNEKLNDELKSLTTEKYELTRKLRELESQNDNDSKLLKEYTEKVNQEYDYKMQRLISQNEKLKSQLRIQEKENEEYSKKLMTFETCEKNMEGRLQITEQTISQCEDTIKAMRHENTNLSHEISLLRSEKEDLQKLLERQQGNERGLRVKMKKLENEYNDVTSRYVMLEREKLQQEKRIAYLNKEIENIHNLKKEQLIKNEGLEKELQRHRQLYEDERKENRRLHERFSQDAELLRKKDADNSAMRTQIENIKTEFESFKTKITADNSKILKIEAEKNALLDQIERIKKTENLQKKHDIITIQNTYVKEFAKRLDYVKANYEREIQALKREIMELRESSPTRQLQVSPNQNSVSKVSEEMSDLQGYYSLHDQSNFHPELLQFDVVNSPIQDIPEKDFGPGTTQDSKHDKILPSENMNTSSSIRLQLPNTKENGAHRNSSVKFTHSELSSPFQAVGKQRFGKGNGMLLENRRNRVENNDQNPSYDFSLEITRLSPTFDNKLNNHHSYQQKKHTRIKLDKRRPEKYPRSNNSTGAARLHSVNPTSNRSNSVSNDSGIINSEHGSLRIPNIPTHAAISNKLDQNKNGSTRSDSSSGIIDIFARIHDAEKRSDNDELRRLLKDVRQEVLMLNKMMDERSTASSTPRSSVTPDSGRGSNAHNNKGNGGTNISMNEEVRRLHEENSELQRRLAEQQKAMQYQEGSCDELYKRRVLLEKLVDRLQTRLREETCKRRQLEQSNNVILEDSKEGLDDSTV